MIDTTRILSGFQQDEKNIYSFFQTNVDVIIEVCNT